MQFTRDINKTIERLFSNIGFKTENGGADLKPEKDYPDKSNRRYCNDTRKPIRCYM